MSKPLFQSALLELLASISGKQAEPVVESGSHHDFNGARVLLAEDNHMNMEAARRILIAAKLEIDSAWNGQ